MLAMLRKDLYVMRGTIILYALMWTVIAAMLAWIPDSENSTLAYIVPVLSGSTVVMYSLDADEKCHWDSFASMTPLCPRQIVLAKYLLSYGNVVLMFLLGLLASWISTSGRDVFFCWPMGFVLLWTDMVLPLRYRFSRGQAMFFLLMIWAGIAALLLNPAGWRIALLLLGRINELSVPVVAVGIAAVIVLSVISIRLSVRFYTSRQRGWYDRG